MKKPDVSRLRSLHHKTLKVSCIFFCFMNNANVLTTFNCFVLKDMYTHKHLNFSNIKITDEEVRAGAKHLFF